MRPRRSWIPAVKFQTETLPDHAVYDARENLRFDFECTLEHSRDAEGIACLKSLIETVGQIPTEIFDISWEYAPVKHHDTKCAAGCAAAISGHPLVAPIPAVGSAFSRHLGPRETSDRKFSQLRFVSIPTPGRDINARRRLDAERLDLHSMAPGGTSDVNRDT